MADVSFRISDSDAAKVKAIVERAQGAGLIHRRYSRLTCRMDLTVVHANGCPMDFQRLLEADDFNFARDICGIARLLDRDTGRLTDRFIPRFAARLASSDAA